MKNLRFILLALVITSFLSCSKDDDGGSSINIVGSWKLVGGGIEPTTFTMEGVPFPIEVSGSFINISDSNRINFLEDNSFTSNTGSITLEMALVVMGVEQTQYMELEDIFGEGTWEINDRKLIVTNDNGTTIPYQIESISETDLVLKANVSDTDTGTGTGVPAGMDIEVVMQLKKV